MGLVAEKRSFLCNDLRPCRARLQPPPMKLVVTVAVCLASIAALGQSSAADRKLLLDNAEMSATRYAIPDEKAIDLSFPAGDGVIVPLNDLRWSKAMSADSDSTAAAGEALYVDQGARPAVSRTASTPPDGTVVAVNLKHHWTSTLRKCEEPRQCVRPVKIGEQVIGETRQLFTNNYISAYRHQLEPGGTLTSSYFTSRGADHVLIVAVTPLTANFSGDEIKLEAGQVYFSTAQEVEVTAGKDRATWVAIRIHAAGTTH